MISYAQIHSAWVSTDASLAEQEGRARSANGRQRCQRARMFNDHAYFVLLFAQLERRIEDECGQLIVSKRAAVEWKSRRLWDGADPERISFMNKVAMLTERGNATYNRIRHYYVDLRCAIAHGDSLAVGPILLPVVAAELKTLARAVKAT